MSRNFRGFLRTGPKKARPHTTDLRAFDSGFTAEPWLCYSLWSMDCNSRGGGWNIHPVPTRHEQTIFPFICSVAAEFISTLRQPLGRATLMQEASVVRGK